MPSLMHACSADSVVLDRATRNNFNFASLFFLLSSALNDQMRHKLQDFLRSHIFKIPVSSAALIVARSRNRNTR